MLFGLLKRREAWCITWRGRLVVFLVGIVTLMTGVRGCAPFLSANQPVEAQVLIVEGWLPDYALKDASEEFKRGKYRYIITSGGPLLAGYYFSARKSSAEMAAATLVELGIASNLVVAVSSPPVARGRTLAEAQSVKKWIQDQDPDLRSGNIYTLGAHSRRSWIAFKKALKDRVKVGVIADADRAYDMERWWATSEGFRSVTSEALAYVVMRLHGSL